MWRGSSNGAGLGAPEGRRAGTQQTQKLDGLLRMVLRGWVPDSRCAASGMTDVCVVSGSTLYFRLVAFSGEGFMGGPSF